MPRISSTLGKHVYSTILYVRPYNSRLQERRGWARTVRGGIAEPRTQEEGILHSVGIPPHCLGDTVVPLAWGMEVGTTSCWGTPAIT